MEIRLIFIEANTIHNLIKQNLSIVNDCSTTFYRVSEDIPCLLTSVHDLTASQKTS